MKKILLFMLLSISVFAVDGHLKVGVITDSKDKAFENYAPTFAGELTQTLGFVDIGAGIGYNGKVAGREIATVPAYGLVKFKAFPVLLKPYVVAKAGKVLHTTEKVDGYDPEGKYFYGAGIGVDFLSLQGEAMYTATKVDNYKDDYLKQVSLSLGYKLF